MVEKPELCVGVFVGELLHAVDKLEEGDFAVAVTVEDAEQAMNKVFLKKSRYDLN